VPVSHEVTLSREPITDANRDQAHAGPAISEEEHEVTLHAERPVVGVEAVAVERVKLGKDTVTGQETVSGEVRKARIRVRGRRAPARRGTETLPTRSGPGRPPGRTSTPARRHPVGKNEPTKDEGKTYQPEPTD
jgi:hypothetical protein